MEHKGYNYFYRTVLVTGPDIIFFWVARMIMAGIEFDGGLINQTNRYQALNCQNWFPLNVYFTESSRDSEGEKCQSLWVILLTLDPLPSMAQMV